MYNTSGPVAILIYRTETNLSTEHSSITDLVQVKGISQIDGQVGLGDNEDCPCSHKPTHSLYRGTHTHTLCIC